MQKNWWDFLKNKKAENSSAQKAGIEPAIQHDIASGIALLVAEVLRSSNHFSEAEEKVVRQFFSTEFKTVNTEVMLHNIRNHFTVGSRPMLRIICKHLSTLVDENSVRHIVKFLMEVAASDDFIHAREMRCIQRIAEYLNINQRTFTELKVAFVSENNPYALLEVSETASLSEVKKAYRAKILKHHPDRRPAWKSEQEAANEFRVIQLAFEKILSGYEKI